MKKNWTIHFEQKQLAIVHWISKHERKCGMFWGFLAGFIANTVIAIFLANTFADVHSAGVTDRVVENRLSNMKTELEWFKQEFTPEPISAKELND